MIESPRNVLNVRHSAISDWWGGDGYPGPDAAMRVDYFRYYTTRWSRYYIFRTNVSYYSWSQYWNYMYWSLSSFSFC